MPASSPALVLHFPAGTTAAERDRLVAVLADHDLLAIQEDDVAAPTTWLAHFASTPDRDAALDALHRLPETAAIRLETAQVDDEDWARRTQANLPAICIGRLIVAPPWDLPDRSAIDHAGSDGAPVVIVIEPSRGFGTGHHQSTRLCLVLLQGRDLAGQSVLDVGTGSGVLSIAAARLGAALVSAIDVDPDAVENARENVERNGVAGAIEAHVRDFVESPPPPADIVLANLTGTLLARHARTLAALVKPRGSLIVSGFTVDERQMVEDAFAPGLSVIESAEEEGWWALVLRPTPS
jgi:ribosomal protein L11 methyltransferase